ncbi:hypothetical protein DPA09_25260, partial [Salmonella enterica subsp. enterica]|nr:hypothetical protein [Salmonella enterica subsp. enterica serovar Mikawasima]
PAAGTEEYMLAQHADQVVVVDATLKDVNGNPVPVWTAAPELRQPNGLGVTITAESGTGLTNAITWKLNAGNLHAPWVTDANTKYEVWAKNSSGALADVMGMPGELPVMPKMTALIAPEAHFITGAARSGASIADTALGLVPEKGLTDGDIPLSKFVTLDPVPSILGEYPAGARPVYTGYKMHTWTRLTKHPIPAKVRVCANVSGIQSPGQCGGEFNPADAPGTRRPLIIDEQVAVDIPKLTVYIGPLYSRRDGEFDGAGREADGNIATYREVCRAITASHYHPEIHVDNGPRYKYTFTRTTLDAPTRLTGSQSVPSDYNYEPGQTFADPNWEAISGTNDTDGTIPGEHVCTGTPGTGSTPGNGVCGSVNLAPTVAGDSDLNYIAGWRYNTNDHSVAMLNVKQGTGAAAPTFQPDGQYWIAGGVACVLDRQ